MDSRAIGVMDSGLGGLTAVRELSVILPHEDIVYIGDTANLPYGAKTPETIVRCTRAAVDFLHALNVKTVLLACGTASSVALPSLAGSLDIPVSGVVEPAVNAAICATRSRRIGVVAPSATIASGAYEKLIHALAPDAYIYSEAYPLLVPLVEEGRFAPDDRVTALVLEEYLQGIKAVDVDTLILGCTHYPLLHDHFARQLPGVALISPGREAALLLKETLSAANLLNEKPEQGSIRFFLSDRVRNFERQASLLMRCDVSGDAAAVTL